VDEEDLVEEVVAIATGVDVSIMRPRDAEAMIDERAFERDEFLPYWADLWPSARLLARTVAGRALRGARVLELGCGLGLPSVAAALAGGRVTATDWSADAVRAAEANARRNDAAVEALVCSWGEPAEAIVRRAPWDLVIAADVLYERRNITPLVELLGRLTAEAWVADPHRPAAGEFLDGARADGWDVDALAHEDRPLVTVHRLRRPAPAAAA
jgi:predicted nicotinamide N-methyase